MTSTKRLRLFFLILITYIIVGILFDWVDIGLEKAIDSLRWKALFQAGVFAIIMTLIQSGRQVAEKEKKD